jgi:hypothetical protein
MQDSQAEEVEVSLAIHLAFQPTFRSLIDRFCENW